mgnify:CR=1 FL=1
MAGGEGRAGAAERDAGTVAQPASSDFPALPAIFYMFAVWFTVRLVRSIRRL